MTLLIDARNLVKRYRDRIAVSDVSLSVAPGEVVAVIGPNGAGKSTTLEMILGLRSRDGGEVRYGCAEPRREIGVQLQSTPFFPGLTAAENLRVFAAFYGRRLSRAETDELLVRCRLQHAARTEASRLSGGEQKRLAIAVALVHQPRALFLDEPTAALDPRARHEIRTLIRELAQGGPAVVFTSHDMEEVGRLADRVVLIVNGRVRAEGAPQALLERHGAASLDELYLNLIAEEAV
ncbi:ABC transporter ATP-binding protein [Symbiobacterium thermophilum]|uniref:ABC transporter ATP-binding protein n=1 Tax=Symbiobacterium thermophilum TaxID=2734 RepID=UPI0035C7042A